MPALPGRILARRLPAHAAQAEALDALLTVQGVVLDAVLSYETPLEEVVARLSGRRTCSACKAIYHHTARRRARKASATSVAAGWSSGRTIGPKRSESGCKPTRRPLGR